MKIVNIIPEIMLPFLLFKRTHYLPTTCANEALYEITEKHEGYRNISRLWKLKGLVWTFQSIINENTLSHQPETQVKIRTTHNLLNKK